MIYKNIPGTDLNPSCICLGTAEFGSAISREDSFRMLDHYIDQGGNFLDTAHCYANWMPGESSSSEKTIGRWIKERNNRSKVIIATKGAHPLFDGKNIPRLHRHEIISDLDESLRFLGVDCIDFYWLHRDDPQIPVGEILETLNEQKKAGKIRYFGCSNWKTVRIQQSLDYASQHGIEGFKGNEILWSYAVLNTDTIKDPTIAYMDDAAIEFHKKTGMAVMPYTSQARGFFTKLDRNGLDSIKDWVKASYHNDENMRRFERLKKLSAELQVPLSALVLAYLTSQPFVTIPIVGSQSTDQMDESLKAGDLVLSPDMLQYLENG